MKWYEYPLRTLGILWCLPVTILIWSFYILPFWAARQIRFAGWHSFGIARFHVAWSKNWYFRLWSKWGGFGGPCVMILNPWSLFETSSVFYTITERHEARHCVQWFVLGLLFPLVYLAGMLIALIQGQNAYRDNWLEKDARKHENA